MAQNTRQDDIGTDRNHRRELMKYRWEFLRRNPDYQRIYKKMIDLWDLGQERGQFLEMQALQHNPENDFSVKREMFKTQMGAIMSETGELDEELKEKFGFDSRKPLDPAKTFEEIEPALNEADAFTRPNHWTTKLKESATALTFTITNACLRIQIDLDRVNSRHALKQELATLVDSSLEKRSTVKLKDFETILKIGDLKSQGMTNTEIAKQVYAGDRDLETSIIKITQHLKTYQDLINGGHEFLMYP